VSEDGERLIVECDGTAAAAADALRGFFEAQARGDIEARLAQRSREMGEPVTSLGFRDQKTLWGSCSPRRRALSFNVKLVMAPPESLDYIVVHELAHFRWRGHGVRFWERVARFCPDFRAHRRWLRDHGWRLSFPSPASLSNLVQ
jgi:predicted metal-dependent hydrolase